MSSTTDKISALPDSLLYHILSFLPVKSAVTTSVLSKRWKPLWQLALTLDFDDERFTDFASFRHLAYSVIMRDPALPIRSFRISCGKSENFDPRDLNQNCDDPSCEFNGFPKLMRAKFSGELQHFPFAWFRTAKYLHLELFRAYQNTVPIFHNLTHIELVFHSNDWEGTKWKWVIQVLQHCPKLQNLTIDEANKYEEVSDNEVWKDPETIPECLLSQLRTCYLPDFRGIQCELQFAKYILANSKLLNIVTIKINCDENKKLEILEKLSAYTRGSPTCKVFLNL